MNWVFRERSAGREIRLKRRHWEVGEYLGKGIAIVFGDDETNARLIAAAPTMYEYIQSSASAGCATAKKILETIDAST